MFDIILTYLIIYSSFDHFSSSGSMAWLKTVRLIHGAFDPRDVVILKVRHVCQPKFCLSHLSVWPPTLRPQILFSVPPIFTSATSDSRCPISGLIRYGG